MIRRREFLKTSVAALIYTAANPGSSQLWLAKVPICRRMKKMNGLSDLVSLRVKLVLCCAC
jgi:hypothetical protein